MSKRGSWASSFSRSAISSPCGTASAPSGGVKSRWKSTITSASDTRRMIAAGRSRATPHIVEMMRLLAFSDLHSDRRQAERLVEMSAEADVVIRAGDLASFHLGLGRMIKALRDITAPTLLVPGNNERESALRGACEDWASATVLHGESTEIAGRHFFGLGAGVPPTPFPFSFDLSEEDAASLLERCPAEAVLVVHSP